jgi:hypothetical protein
MKNKQEVSNVSLLENPQSTWLSLLKPIDDQLYRGYSSCMRLLQAPVQLIIISLLLSIPIISSYSQESPGTETLLTQESEQDQQDQTDLEVLDSEELDPIRALIDSIAPEPEVIRFEPRVPSAFSLSFRIGLFWLGNSEDLSNQGVEVSPLRGNLGFSMRLPLAPRIDFEPALDFFYGEYVYKEDLGRALPTQMETGKNDFTGPIGTVLGIVLQLPFGFHIPMSEVSSFVIRPGLTAVFRFPIQGLGGTELQELSPMTQDLNGGGRFLFPELGFGFSFQISQAIGFDINFRALFPIWQLWDPREIPFWDTLFLWGQAGLRFYL